MEDHGPVRVPDSAALASIVALLVDLDGVLYVEDHPVPGAQEAIRRLRRAGMRLRFVTNTTSRPRSAIVDRLGRLGFDVPETEVVTPAALAVGECRRRGLTRVSLLMKQAVKADFAELGESDKAVDAVIVGDLGQAFDYDVLNAAFRHLMDGAALLALQKNRYWMTPDGIALDVGPFVAALEYGAAQDAIVVGKPSRSFFAGVLEDLGVDARDTAMIGDDVESDVGGALAAGMTGILVRTGKFREDALHRSGVAPTLTLDSIADLPGVLAAL